MIYRFEVIFMSIQRKVDAAKTVLRTASQLVGFCMETKNFIHHTEESLFAKILARDDLSEEQKENEIDITTAGILVVALSSHRSRYKSVQNKEDHLSPYLWDANGYLKSPYYPKQYKEVLAISGINESTEQDNEAADAYNERLVLAVGTKVMNGELPFQPEILNEIFDKHTQDARDELHRMVEFFRDKLAPGKAEEMEQGLSNNIIALKGYMGAISAKINQTPRYYGTSSILSETATHDAYTIEAIFNRALNTAAAGNDTPEKKKFMEGLVALKQATLASFQKGEANYGFVDCETIANSALTLATKVGSNTVTQADVNQFTQATQKYKTSHAFAIVLAVIVGAVIGMIAGAAIGFAVGNVPGAIIGVVAGLVVGGSIAGVSSTMWYTKKEPLNKVSSAATEVISSQNSI